MSSFKDRIKAKLAQLNNKTGGGAYWTPPKEGKATIRMFAYPHSEDPFLEYWFHYGLGNQSFLCPQKNGKGACAACEASKALYNSKDPSAKEFAKKIFAKQRFYGVVIDRADEEPTPKYWGFGQTVYLNFLTKLSEDGGDYENFLDVDSGLDLVVEMVKPAGKTMSTTNVDFKRRESPLAASKQQIKAILEAVRPAEEVFVIPTSEEVQRKIDEWTESGGSSTPSVTQTEKGETSDAQGNAVSDVESAFDNAFKAFE